MNKSNRTLRNPTANTARFTPLKHKAESAGIPYGSVRDAHFRNELPVLKIGRNEKYQRWYVTDRDWDAWIQSRMTGATR